MNDAIVTPLGFSHVRLTVTDIRRSKVPRRSRLTCPEARTM